MTSGSMSSDTMSSGAALPEDYNPNHDGFYYTDDHQPMGSGTMSSGSMSSGAAVPHDYDPYYDPYNYYDAHPNMNNDNMDSGMMSSNAMTSDMMSSDIMSSEMMSSDVMSSDAAKPTHDYVPFDSNYDPSSLFDFSATPHQPTNSDTMNGGAAHNTDNSHNS